MNNKRIVKILNKYNDNINFDVIKSSKDVLKLEANITSPDYFKDDIYVRVIIFSSGTIHLFMTFDQIKENEETLSLINKFNDASPFLKAYITKKNNDHYLELHSAILQNKRIKAKEINFIINYLICQVIEEPSYQCLKALSDLTFNPND